MAAAGILIVDKPANWTSFDVVAYIRRRAGVRRVGHAGTLDPAATGVLPICLGAATRVIEYLMEARKTYRATVLLGTTTDTYDTTGQTVRQVDAMHIARSEIETALEQFRGDIEQRPPAFSALKRNGVPLYRLARAGESVTVEPRPVTIYGLLLQSYEAPRLELEIECSKGTYIRSIAHDLGEMLAVGGCLEALIRTAVGPFLLEDAVALDRLGTAFEAGSWKEHLLPVDEVLLHWPAAILSTDNERRVLTGRTAEVSLGPRHDAGDRRLRAYGPDGDFLAILHAGPEGLKPEKVFHREGAPA